jgi:hypothetical protein
MGWEVFVFVTTKYEYDFIVTLDIHSWGLNAWSLGYSCVALWQFSYLPAANRAVLGWIPDSRVARGSE